MAGPVDPGGPYCCTWLASMSAISASSLMKASAASAGMRSPTSVSEGNIAGFSLTMSDGSLRHFVSDEQQGHKVEMQHSSNPHMDPFPLPVCTLTSSQPSQAAPERPMP